MNVQEDFFSSKHKQLLNVATWAKYLAWVVLIIFTLDAIAIFIQGIANVNALAVNAFSQNVGCIEMLRNEPAFEIRALLDVLSVFFKGIVYYLVLRGLSLGLNMIVETDINYRENKEQRGAE